jgi:transcriptional regulator with XRE-family HTH domain
LADDYHITLERPFVRDTRNALALRTARLSAGLSLEALAEASGVDITRLQDAEDTESRVDLTFDEWVRLAVVFEGHTLAEF